MSFEVRCGDGESTISTRMDRRVEACGNGGDLGIQLPVELLLADEFQSTLQEGSLRAFISGTAAEA